MPFTHSAHHTGLFDSLKGLGRTVLDVLHTRIQLLVTEVAEEQANLAERLLIAALAMLCFLLGVAFVAFFIVIMLWETPYRNWAAGLIALALFAGAATLWMMFRAKGREKPSFLASTLHELAVDRDRLR